MPSPGSTAASPAVIRRGLGLLARAVREQPRIFSVALAGSTLYALMTVLSAVVLGRVTQHVVLPAFSTGHTTAGALAAAAALIIGVSVLKCVGVVTRRVGAGMLQYRLMGDYRRRVTRQYLRLPLSWHQEWSTGTLLSNANSDIEAMWENISPFPLSCGVLVMLVGTAVVLVLTDWLLALIGFVVFPLVGLLTWAYLRVVAPRAMHAQELRGAVSSTAHDSFDGALVVKTLGREADETERFKSRSLELRDALVHVGRLRGLFDPLLEALPNLGVLACLLVGSYQLESGAINAGQLVSVTYLFTLLAMPIRAIGYVFADMPKAVVGSERVFRVLDAEGSMPYGDGTLSSHDSGVGLSLRSVEYAYGDNDPVLQRITLDIPVGKTIAVVGPTGSGKSTLAGLLVRLVDPDDGTVLYDGVDVRSLRQGQVSDAAALVPQSTFLFDDTVRGNITLGADLDDDEVWAALRTAQADRFVRALPRGLDTVVGERGTTLSGGQRQRLALARAVVRRPRLLLLDDSTSSVDPQVEQAILAGLSGIGATGTASVLVVAHRKATIALADEVVFVDQGTVVARGTHTELLSRVEGYRDLVNAYEQAEEDEGLGDEVIGDEEGAA